jgi:transcription antitermination protein NusB
MLNRRHLRIKTLQALYAFLQSGNDNVSSGEAEMIKSVQDILPLYLLQISLLREIYREGLKEREEAKRKLLPSEADLKPQTNFTANPVMQALNVSDVLDKTLNARKINWDKDLDLVRKLWRKWRQSEAYQQYIHVGEPTLNEHVSAIENLCISILFEDDALESKYEEWNIHWQDDLYVVNPAVIKSVQEISKGKNWQLPALLKDAQDDERFVRELFRHTVVRESEFEKWIQEKAENWELERIAIMDMLLMKMALAELINFPEIPVKVTLNEYIEISKYFSSPKSNSFINGILDKLVLDLKSKGVIQKLGRGLIENKSKNN